MNGPLIVGIYKGSERFYSTFSLPLSLFHHRMAETNQCRRISSRRSNILGINSMNVVECLEPVLDFEIHEEGKKLIRARSNNNIRDSLLLRLGIPPSPAKVPTRKNGNMFSFVQPSSSSKSYSSFERPSRDTDRSGGEAVETLPTL